MKAFTLLELLLVLAITTALMSSGLAGLSYLRKSQYVQAEAENIREFLREVKSKAMTSSLNNDRQWVYGYLVKIEEGENKLFVCELLHTGEGIPQDVSLFWDNGSWWNQDCTTVGYTPFGQLDIETTCDKIGFSSVNGFMHIWPSDNGDSCQLTLDYGGMKRNVVIDTSKGDIHIAQGV
uniref:Prepilin-type N-terminal cleavage/methylation domain-containing protein n=1 Tax=candidate division CPR3 bacterium TaxID=2268181 RepID=A0A7C5URV3_UNCC3